MSDESNSTDLASRAMLQRMDDIVASIRDVRQSQTASSLAEREMALKVERVLVKIDELSRIAEGQRVLERRVDAAELSLAMVEQKASKTQMCVENRHEKRIEGIEKYHIKMTSSVIAIVVIIQLALYLAKEFM